MEEQQAQATRAVEELARLKFEADLRHQEIDKRKSDLQQLEAEWKETRQQHQTEEDAWHADNQAKTSEAAAERDRLAAEAATQEAALVKKREEIQELEDEGRRGVEL